MGLNKPKLEPVNEVNNTSFREVFSSIKATAGYIKSKWYWILIFAIVGAVSGFLYSASSKTEYTAECTFVLDEESGAKSSGLSALGLGIGGGKGGDFFSATDNIIWLYSSRLMLQKALLTSVDSAGKNKLLIDWFIQESELGKNEFSKTPSLKDATFTAGDTTLTRAQNAIIGRCAGLIKARYLKVATTPKTENVIGVSFKSKDELLSQAFTNELVTTVNSYYIQTKTKKAVAEVVLLERKAAEYKAAMSSDIYEVASGYDDAPYPNPNRTVLQVTPQRKQVDAKISGEIYGGLIQQLELSRTNLQKQTPLIQIIEEPILPLNSSSVDMKFAVIGGILLFGLLTLVFLGVKYQVGNFLAETDTQTNV